MGPQMYKILCPICKYFVSDFIADYAFLLYYGLLNGPENLPTENARWQPRIGI